MHRFEKFMHLTDLLLREDRTGEDRASQCCDNSIRPNVGALREMDNASKGKIEKDVSCREIPEDAAVAVARKFVDDTDDDEERKRWVFYVS